MKFTFCACVYSICNGHGAVLKDVKLIESNLYMFIISFKQIDIISVLIPQFNLLSFHIYLFLSNQTMPPLV